MQTCIPVVEMFFAMTRPDPDNYYTDNAQDYFDETKALDPSFYLFPFTKRLRANDPVLDLGCGSGRDLLWLKNKGFQPTGIEKSKELARLASEFSGCPVIHGDYCSMDFSGFSAKGLIFSASLVHLPHDQVEGALLNILPALDTDGFVYISLKKGEGLRIDDWHRIFYLWQDGDVRMLLEAAGLAIVDFRETGAARKTGETWLSYCVSRG